jgi:carbonic anhydrase
MVLGHDACGAVDATLKSVSDGSTLPGHLPVLVSAIRPAVEAVKNQGGDVLANAIRANVKLNVEKLQTTSPILDKAVGDKSLRVVGAVYRLASGKVDLV